MAAAAGTAGDLLGLDPWLGSASVLAGGTFVPGGLGRGLRTTGDAMVGDVMVNVEVEVRRRRSPGNAGVLRRREVKEKHSEVVSGECSR